MTIYDWLVVAAYVAATLAIGVYFTRRAAASTTDFFLAGRSLPWFIAGTSIVATSYSSDTPLFVAGMSRTEGIHGNWFWWAFALGNLASVFFFSRLWRRTEAITDVEFVSLRYEPGRATSFLRGFKAIFDGLVVNCVIMASVTVAMTKVLAVLLNLSDVEAVFTLPLFGPVTQTTAALALLSLMAAIYTTMSGLYGVVYTDLIQFALAMTGSVILAALVYMKASAVGLLEQLAASPDFKPATLHFFPDFTAVRWSNLLTLDWGGIPAADMAAFTFVVYIGAAWWAGAPGSGYLVQRLLATKSEKDALYANLWFTFCHYVLRPWPWILVGLISMIYFPGIADAESAYPEMIHRFMPIGLKGVMVASLLAAFMSTLDTHLNWGASYLINDLYRPFLATGRTAAHYVRASRVCMLLLACAAILVGTRLSGILDAYKYIGVINGGVALVMILRWYWWRVNPWSEISAMAASLLCGNLAQIYLANYTDDAGAVHDFFALRLVLVIAATTAVWVMVTFLTGAAPQAQVRAFHRKMRIGGIGWRRVSREEGGEDAIDAAPRDPSYRLTAAAWLSASCGLYAVLLGVGKLLFHQWRPALFFLVLLVVSGYALHRCLCRMNALSSSALERSSHESH